MIQPSKLFGRLGNTMFQGAYLIAQAERGEIPDIYVQDYELFDDYRDKIKAIYSQGSHTPIDMVAIHVRRGDYVNNPFYVDLFFTAYYERAMAEFPDCEFLVFSDDIEWCKKQPIFASCEFSEGNDEIVDFNLMSACKGLIMANSSYSWWASYLSNAKVVAPKEWFSDGIIRCKLLPEWTTL